MADHGEESRQLPVIDERQLELFKQFVAIQKEELDLRGKQLGVREKEIAVEDSNLQREHEYALKALDAQSRDREADRQFRRKAILWSFRFGVLLVILLGLFCAYALYLGKLDMVKDITLQIFGTGGIGAAMFFAARSIYKGQKRPNDDD
jgi:hypothetical protein